VKTFWGFGWKVIREMGPLNPWLKHCNRLNKNFCTFSWTVIDVGNSLIDDSRIVVEIVVKLAFIDQLRMIWVYRLDFDGDFKVCFGVDGLIYLPEGSLINFPDDLEVFSNLLKHLRHVCSQLYIIIIRE
jgi:hypothetical protein